MSETFYRVLHYVAVFFFLSGIGASFMGAERAPKITKIITGIASLLIFVAGMGLIAKALQLPHGGSWPGYLHAKITIWALVTILGPVLAKRLTKGRLAAFYGIVILASCAAYLAVTAPF
ncbi:hypothetical protein HBN50_10610 [Halobacteriovorax sp. GB3]|uniref:hypothetical protein n=1 Tax=Halobacteriovorax sp. GB3 TaxID=2719615 RepID=UPI00236123D0|nr:hypothetical protein [Halobacteriovorax sp. GB3]MDD0853553.1 hypothetical protein [Halobacteriovorax sp. GB3]